jgi:long-chain acyl-CoA synthetase
MNFLENIFSRLNFAGDRVILAEAHVAGNHKVTAAGFLAQVARARCFLRDASLVKGDRCIVAAHNSARWAALDLAVMAEGLIAVPLYARQSPLELVSMMRDAGPRLVCCGDAALRDSLAARWPDSPRLVLFDEIFHTTPAGKPAAHAPPAELAPEDPVTIIYTSGTSGEPKGVVLTVANLDHMLRCTTERLDQLMGARSVPDRVFHYLPFCFAGSWILLLTCLLRTSALTLSTDLTRLAEEIRSSAPDYFLNVPALLERVRSRIEESFRTRGGSFAKLFDRARAAWLRLDAKAPETWDFLWVGLAGLLIFPAVRRRLDPNLRALICGSAPLSRETQLFFMMLGIPVLQVYGLTETTGICTMDEPRHVEPGRVGPAISGIEMKLGENGEILVRGPNIFPGYWNRPEQTAQVFQSGWFCTGDQGDVDASGNWRVTGRLKNLIVLSSGHNVAPEPLEEELLHALPGAQQVVLVGNGKSCLAAIITGNVAHSEIEAQLERLNATLPHYRKVRMFHAEPRPFTIESGLLTVNGKLKRDAIAERFAPEIERMYAKTEQASSRAAR